MQHTQIDSQQATIYSDADLMQRIGFPIGFDLPCAKATREVRGRLRRRARRDAIAFKRAWLNTP